jgi:hypothetical protein
MGQRSIIVDDIYMRTNKMITQNLTKSIEKYYYYENLYT